MPMRRRVRSRPKPKPRQADWQWYTLFPANKTSFKRDNASILHGDKCTYVCVLVTATRNCTTFQNFRTAKRGLQKLLIRNYAAAPLIARHKKILEAFEWHLNIYYICWATANHSSPFRQHKVVRSIIQQQWWTAFCCYPEPVACCYFWRWPQFLAAVAPTPAAASIIGYHSVACCKAVAIARLKERKPLDILEVGTFSGHQAYAVEQSSWPSRLVHHLAQNGGVAAVNSLRLPTAVAVAVAAGKNCKVIVSWLVLMKACMNLEAYIVLHVWNFCTLAYCLAV